jgi:hypothetical protein
MTFKANEVLGDCRVALQILENEKDLQKWRIIWAAALALLRTVGHVLDKVDGQDRVIKEISSSLYKKWRSEDPEHLIFREFIEEERNNLLKEYNINLHPYDNVPVVAEYLLQPMHGGDPVAHREVFEIEENIYRPLMDGPWEGHDARDVLQEAITWWEIQLATVDAFKESKKECPQLTGLCLRIESELIILSWEPT